MAEKVLRRGSGAMGLTERIGSRGDVKTGFELAWGEYGTGSGQFGLVAGLAFADDGSVWVADPGNARLMRFVLPAPASQ
jgi:hypothetical protein